MTIEREDGKENYKYGKTIMGSNSIGTWPIGNDRYFPNYVPDNTNLSECSKTKTVLYHQGGVS